jgi:hypothetical protein
MELSGNDDLGAAQGFYFYEDEWDFAVASISGVAFGLPSARSVHGVRRDQVMQIVVFRF